MEGGTDIGTQWVRGELRKDELAHLLERVAAYVVEHKNQVIGGAAAVVGVALVTWYLVARNARMMEEADGKLSQGMGMTRQGMADQALATYDEVIQYLGRTRAAPFAYLYKGDLLFSKGRFQEAADTYSAYLAKFEANQLTAHVLLGLGRAYEGLGNLSEAVKGYERFLDKFADRYLAPEAIMGLARCYEGLGQKESAVPQYERIATLYPNTLWTQMAQMRLAMLRGQPLPPPPPKEEKKASSPPAVSKSTPSAATTAQ